MKKIILILIGLFVFGISFSQTQRPVYSPFTLQQFGNGTTITRFNGAAYPVVGIMPAIWQDTATMNASALNIKNIPLFQASTADGKNWFRSLDLSKWVEFLNSGSSGIGTVTSVSQGYGIINTPNPITTTGTVKFDSATVFPQVRATMSLQKVTDVDSVTSHRIGINISRVDRETAYKNGWNWGNTN